MADVQKENGYTAIAHELLEAICKSGFTATEMKVILAIARYTYGFHKTEAEISLGTIADFIKYKDRAGISRAVTRLMRMKVIQLVGKNGQARVLKLNKDYDLWETSCCQNDNCCRNDNSTVAKMTTPKPDFSEEFESLWKIYPRKKGRNAISKKTMKELEKAGFETLKKAIENYKEEIRRNHTDEQYILHGSTFFNGRWKDYVESEVTADADSKPRFIPSTGFRRKEE